MNNQKQKNQPKHDPVMIEKSELHFMLNLINKRRSFLNTHESRVYDALADKLFDQLANTNRN
jgi:hypothetical protein